jgi:predicted transcriptional regulator
MKPKTDRPTKDRVIFVRADADLTERLEKAAELLDRPGSQLVREAVNEKLNKLARRFPELKAA